MFTSFSAALTGLAANEVGVDVVGTNLANLNTTGYKASVVSFYDLVAQSLGLGSGASVGLGTGKPRVVARIHAGRDSDHLRRSGRRHSRRRLLRGARSFVGRA